MDPSASPSLAELFNHGGGATYSSTDDDQYVLQVINSHREDHTPLLLTFTDLTYSVKAPREDSFFSSRRNSVTIPADRTPEATNVTHSKPRMKTLLDSVTGKAREGEIVAVLGASGSGKSTLIDALAGRISRGSLQGDIMLNGEKLDGGGQLFKAISAYVRQDDLLFPMLTVEETLMFSAEFRLPRSLSSWKKKERVETLIDRLGLSNAAKTIIGDENHRGVSGGERRRVSIGTDIIHDPLILFLDEPTSGLDSTSAFLVVKVLQRIARSGSILVMSIHQPSYRIINLLDHLMFLSRGSTVFCGKPSELRPYMSDFGYPIPENENPTEYTLDVIRELEGKQPNGSSDLVKYSREWKKLTINGSRCIDPAVQVPSLKQMIAQKHPTIDVMKTFANPFWVELGVLVRRAFLNTRRSPEVFVTRMGAVLVTGFILATIFWKLDTTPKGVQERLGFIAFAMSTMFYTCADALPVFLQERDIFMRETAYNAYRRSSYVVSNSIVALPGLIFLSLTFAVTTFFAVGLAGGSLQGFGFFFLIILASFWAGSSFVTFLSGVLKNVMLGYTVVVALLAYFLLFSGFFITKDRIPGYWIWFHYLSLVKYPYEAVLLNEFDDPARCFVRGVQIFDSTPLAHLRLSTKIEVLKSMSKTLGFTISPTTCFTTGVDILQQQSITGLSKWNSLLVTVTWGFFFRILFYFSLLFGSKNKRS